MSHWWWVGKVFLDQYHCGWTMFFDRILPQTDNTSFMKRIWSVAWSMDYLKWASGPIGHAWYLKMKMEFYNECLCGLKFIPTWIIQMSPWICFAINSLTKIWILNVFSPLCFVRIFVIYLFKVFLEKKNPTQFA